MCFAHCPMCGKEALRTSPTVNVWTCDSCFVVVKLELIDVPPLPLPGKGSAPLFEQLGSRKEILKNLFRKRRKGGEA